MQQREVLFGEVLQLKDDIARRKHLLKDDMKLEWEALKGKTKVLEPNISGCLLSLAKRPETDMGGISGSMEEIASLLSEFKDFKGRVFAI